MKDTKLGRYVWNLLISIDQLFNAIFGGDPDETISSRLGKIITDRPESCVACVYICKVLHWIDPNHCVKVIEDDRGDREIIR